MFASFEQVANTVLENKLNNALFVKPAIVKHLSENGLKASVQILGDENVLTDIEVYNVRDLNVGDTCFVVHWGANGKRLSNMAVLFGGSRFRF